MTVRWLIGDVRARLLDLTDGSVDCVVTSPPYYGLREYGTATWEGGSADCNHVVGELRRGVNLAASVVSTRGGGKKAAEVENIQAKGVCPHCGAQRVDRQIGLELTPDEYIATMVAVFREVRRVLRDDGTLWLNLGDSYANSFGSESSRVTERDDPAWHGSGIRNHPKHPRSLAGTSLKPKDLMMMPARVALALQADGWFLRSMLPWVKRNPMPESTKDRPTSAIEYVFMLTKSAKYFYDYEAVKRKVSGNTRARLARNGSAKGSTRANGGTREDRPTKALAPTGWDTGEGAHGTIHREGCGKSTYGRHTLGDAVPPTQRRKLAEPGSGIKNNGSMDEALAVMPDARAYRNSDPFYDSLSGPCGAIIDADGQIVAIDIPSQGYSAAHFATFPARLIEPFIIASSSAKGCCASCGAPWERKLVRSCAKCGEPVPTNAKSCKACGHVSDWEKGRQICPEVMATDWSTPGRGTPRLPGGFTSKTSGDGWFPSCSCNAEIVPSTVLDPFGGAGTTGLVADRLGRDAVLIDLNPQYGEMARERIQADAGLFFDEAAS